MNNKIPLIYFHQIFKGRYVVAWPVFIVGDDKRNLNFTVSAEPSLFSEYSEFNESALLQISKYQTRQVKQRLHQSSFRELVLKAYRNHCAVCSLKHRSLLDAAHIIQDFKGGMPVVKNGLSLCKIHHAAYDNNILGISPDYLIEIRKDILDEIDGPMLKYGLQQMNNTRLLLPQKVDDKPSKEFLDIRYQYFKSA